MADRRTASRAANRRAPVTIRRRRRVLGVSRQQQIENLYRAFNARDIDAVLAAKWSAVRCVAEMSIEDA
jgi:hypothetical protein